MNHQEHDRDPLLIDPDTDIELADQGLPGFSAAETLDYFGRSMLWIVDRDQLGVPGTDHGAVDPPEHETHAGALPDEWRERIAAAPLRCAQPRKDGHPCRVQVSAPGVRCGWHRPKPEMGRVSSATPVNINQRGDRK
jgi:hypothetical protein